MLAGLMAANHKNMILRYYKMEQNIVLLIYNASVMFFSKKNMNRLDRDAGEHV